MELIEICEEKLKEKFKKIDEIAYFNQIKVLNAFNEYRVATRHFNGTTGYGYDDASVNFMQKLSAPKAELFRPIFYRARTH